jgi:hypothetical protein
MSPISAPTAPSASSSARKPACRYQNNRDALWQATYTDPHPYTSPRRSWRAEFGDSVPAEAIAAFLAALCDPAGLDPDRDV